MAERDNRLAVGLGFGLVLALLVIAFLAGRMWFLGSPPGTPAKSPPTDDASVTRLAPPNATEPAPAGPSGPGELRVERRDGGIFITDDAPAGTITEKNGQILIASQGQPMPEDAPVGPAAVAPVGAEPVAQTAQADPLRPAVQAYLNKVAAMQVGPLGINPRKFSESMAQGIAQGKMDEFEKLISDVDGVLADLNALDPPAPCRKLHEQLLDVTGQSRDILAEIQDSLADKDMTRLQLITARAQVLQAKIQATEGLQEQLRKQYGVE